MGAFKFKDMISLLCVLSLLRAIGASRETPLGTKTRGPFSSAGSIVQTSSEDTIIPSHYKRLTEVDAASDNHCFGKFNTLLPCKLNYVLLKRLFNSCNATWIINDEALIALHDDLQAVIECSEPGEIILFQVSHMIQPSRTMVIPHSLVFANEGSDELANSNADPYPTSFTCPPSSPLLEIETTEFDFARFNVVDCDDVATVITYNISDCSAETPVVLKDILFQNNTASRGHSLIDAKHIDCGSLLLDNIDFLNNTCRGQACFYLPLESIITSGSYKANEENSHAAETAIFHIPFEGSALFQGLESVGNQIRMFYVNSSAKITVLDSSFGGNSIEVSSASSIEGKKGAVLYSWTDASVHFANSSFTGNKAYGGGAIATYASQMDVKDCNFIANWVKEHGGAISLHKDTHLTISDSNFQGNEGDVGGGIEADGGSWATVKGCKFWDNNADKGAAIVMNSKSHLVATDSAFINNKADISGAIEAADKSTIDVSKCTFKSNFANYGGALYVSKSSEGSIKECSFSDNSGVQNGGAIEVCEQSSVGISDSIFKENRGNWGGAVSVLDNSEVLTSSSKFLRNNASCGGAFWVVDGSSVNLTDCLLSHNLALEDGGAIEFHNHVKATISKSVFEDNHAKKRGGAVFADVSSQSVVKDSNFTSNVAQVGGGIYMVESKWGVTGAYMFANHAEESGDTIAAVRSTFTIDDNEFKQSKVEDKSLFEEMYPTSTILVT